MVREIKTLVDIYSAPDKKGVQRLIKKNVEMLKLINREQILYVDEYIDHRGKNISKYSYMKLLTGEAFKIKHKFSEMRDWVIEENRVTVKGFRP
jgi:hypothetical protein